MPIGTSKTLNYKDLRNSFHTGAQRLSHQNSSALDRRSMADIVCHCYYHCRHHNNLPHLEAQTR